MSHRSIGPNVQRMTADEQQRDKLRDEENRGEFALRRAGRRLAAEEHVLEGRLDELRVEEERVAGVLAADYRRQHWHKDPPPRGS
jgi:hypothetical protein